MPGLYVAVYQAHAPQRGHDSEMAAAFYKAVQSGFPYDHGDDPAFFSALYHHGPVTWGVCRPNIRCPIRKNDGVVFFAEQERNYRFVAALRVADKMKHTGLSKHPLFCQYFNLVIRSRGAGWEHHEPISTPHPDWLWKVTCKSLAQSLPKKTGREKQWEAAGKSHTPGQSLTIEGHPVPIAANYVVFSRSSAVRAHHPPVVARCYEGERHETWEGDSRSQEIRQLVFRDGCRCYLRISDKSGGHPQHPHIYHPQLEESELEETFRRLRDLTAKL